MKATLLASAVTMIGQPARIVPDLPGMTATSTGTGLDCGSPIWTGGARRGSDHSGSRALQERPARIASRQVSFVEVYGSPLPLIDIPVWHVSITAPLGNWEVAPLYMDTIYREGISNTDIWYQADEERGAYARGRDDDSPDPPVWCTQSLLAPGGWSEDKEEICVYYVLC